MLVPVIWVHLWLMVCLEIFLLATRPSSVQLCMAPMADSNSKYQGIQRLNDLHWY